MYVNWVRSAELLLHHTEILDHITQTMDNPKLSKKRTNRNNRHSWHWVATKKDYLAIMKKFLHPLLDKKMVSLKEYGALFSFGFDISKVPSDESSEAMISISSAWFPPEKYVRTPRQRTCYGRPWISATISAIMLFNFQLGEPWSAIILSNVPVFSHSVKILKNG